MSWFKIDDTLAGHPKPRRAGLAAMGLWTVAGSWSSQQLTEGFVPEWFVETWPQGKKLAAKLVSAGLWESRIDPETGWQFHDWTDCNPTAEQERARRKAAAERQKRARERASEARDAERDARESRDTSRVTHGSSHAPPVPSRPDPSPLSSSKTSRGDVHLVDARDPNEPPRCSQHKAMRREDVPSCWACGHKREQWEMSRSSDFVFQRAPWCGDDGCNPMTRQRETPLGVIRCPECHPLAEESA